jgi:membrane protein
MKKNFIMGIRKLVRSVVQDDFYGMAAEMGFMMVIGSFPFMLFLMALFGWMGDKTFIEPVLKFLSVFMPAQAMDLILTVLSEVMFSSKGGLIATIGFVITVILSANAMAVILKGLNRAYKVEETRNFVYTRVLSFLMLCVNTLVLFLSINLIVFGRIIVKLLVNYAGLPDSTAFMLLTLRWPVAFAALFLMAFLCYYILPDLKGRERHKRKSAVPGACFFCIFWLAGSWGFSLYVNNLHTYNFVYGTIGAFAVLMVWFYYTSLLILIGGEINSQVYNKIRRKADEVREELGKLRG